LHKNGNAVCRSTDLYSRSSAYYLKKEREETPYLKDNAEGLVFHSACSSSILQGILTPSAR